MKRYLSEKEGGNEADWRHTKVTLSPTNPEYSPIILSRGDAESVQVVAEFVTVLRGDGISGSGGARPVQKHKRTQDWRAGAVSIVIAPWRAPDLGVVGGDVGDSGFPVRARKTPSSNGMPRSRAETWIQGPGRTWTRTC